MAVGKHQQAPVPEGLQMGDNIHFSRKPIGYQAVNRPLSI